MVQGQLGHFFTIRCPDSSSFVRLRGVGSGPVRMGKLPLTPNPYPAEGKGDKTTVP